MTKLLGSHATSMTRLLKLFAPNQLALPAVTAPYESFLPNSTIGFLIDITETESNREQELSTFAALTILFCFIFSFLISHEVSLQDSLKLCAILALDLTTGAIIWILLSRKSEYSSLELFGVGVALGTSLNAVGQLTFRGTFFGSLFNYVFLMLVVVFSRYFQQRSQFIMKITPVHHTSILAVCSTSLVLLCGDRYYLWAGVLILAIAIYVLTKFKHNPSSNKSRSLFVLFSLGSVALALFSASILERVIFGSRSATSYLGSWDAVYAEASSKSVTNYGPFDNIFLANTKNAYYWFSYAWSGAITDRSNVSDWIVTTQFGFILVALATMSIIFAILQSESKKKLGVAPLLVVTATSLIGSSNFLVDTGSFSQCISIMYLSVIFLVAKDFLAAPNRLKAILFPYFIGILVLTKLTIAIPVITGLCLFVFLSWFSRASQKQIIYFSLSIFVSGITSLALFFVFINQQSEFQNRQSEFTIKVVANAFGMGTGTVLIDLAILLLLKFPIFHSFFKSRDQFVNLMKLVIITSLSLSLVISSSWNNQANTYLLLPCSLSIGFVISIRLTQITVIKKCYFQKYFYAASAIGVGLGFATTTLLYFLQFHFVSNDWYFLLVSLIPLLTFIAIGGISSIKKIVINRRKNFVSLLAIAYLASSVGSYVAHSFRGVEREIIFTNNNWDLPGENIETPNSELHGVVDFMLITLDFGDVLADNSSSNVLISARTGIRSFASTYGRDFSIAHDLRFFTQTEFAESPNYLNYEYLRKECVTWFYYDKTEKFQNLTSFNPYAATMYEDEFGVVMKLSETYPLPKKCHK